MKIFLDCGPACASSSCLIAYVKIASGGGAEDKPYHEEVEMIGGCIT